MLAQVRSVWRHLKCRFANARPEPDFKYCSNFTARSRVANSTAATNFHGRPDAVCGDMPALCAAILSSTFAVKPE